MNYGEERYPSITHYPSKRALNSILISKLTLAYRERACKYFQKILETLAPQEGFCEYGRLKYDVEQMISNNRCDKMRLEQNPSYLYAPEYVVNYLDRLNRELKTTLKNHELYKEELTNVLKDVESLLERIDNHGMYTVWKEDTWYY